MISNRSLFCARCCRLLTSHWGQIRGASFVSLSALIGNDCENELPSIVEKNAASKKLKPSSEVRQEQKSSRPTMVDAVLESLFSSNQQQRPKDVRLRYSKRIFRPSPRESVPKAPIEDEFDILKRMLYTEEASLEKTWSQCRKVIKLEPWNSAESRVSNKNDIPLSMQHVFRDLLLAICRSRSREPFRISLPSPAGVIKTYLKHKIMRYWWDKVLWIQIGVLVDWSHHASMVTSTTDVSATENAVRLFNDILGVWEIFIENYSDCKLSRFAQVPSEDSGGHNLFLYPTSQIHASHNQKIKWRGLPTYEDHDFRSLEFPTSLSHRFLHYLPKHPNNRQASSIVGAGVLTRDCFKVLLTKFSLPQSSSDYARPFLKFIDHIVNGAKLDRPTASDCLLRQGISSEIVDVALNGWGPKPAFRKSNIISKNIRPPIKGESPVSRETSLKASTDQEQLAVRSNEFTSISKDLTRATERSDIEKAIILWHNFESRLKLKNSKEELLQRLNLQFLSAFFNLRRPERAAEVWNCMINLGYKPTERHWHAMILGCAKIKDLESMQGVWALMRNAGIEPDMHLWTAWIHGLIKCGSWQLGLEALEELGRLWGNATSTHKQENESKLLAPSIVPVNAAIAAFQAIGKADIVPHLLKWAKSQNLRLNTSTFNTMLRHSILKVDDSAANEILLSMEQHQCTPDIVTFTIILNGLVSNLNSSFHTNPPEEQKAIILSTLRDLEQKGLPANAHTYTTIIDGLLSSQTPNLPATRAVLDHMAQNNFKVSPHIYTIISAHYFSASPPDLTALEVLWRRILAEKGILDPIFYDRMIEGYARIGEIEKMIFFLKRASMEGKTPSWVALAEAMKALYEAHEWELVRDLVADVLDADNGVLRHGEGGKTGRDRFWGMVDELVQKGVVEAPEGI